MIRASRMFILTALIFFALPVHTLDASELININTADAETLDTLPEIGPVYAERIIAYREGPDGPFETIEEIQNVSGIGPATFAKIESLITVETGGISEDVSSESDEVEGDGGSGDRETPVSVERLRISAPKTTFVHQEVSFVAVPVPERTDRLMSYTWNFGDTKRGERSSPVHRFEYPGTYVVTVESLYKGERHSARHTITVLPTMFSLTRDGEGNIQINNDALHEVDMSGFLLVSANTFIIPEGTILLPYGTLTISRERVEGGVWGTPRLYDSMRTLVATYEEQRLAPVEADESVEEVSKESLLNDNLQASAGSADTGYRDMAYIGLVGVLVIGILGVYVRKREDDIEEL